MPEQLQQPHPEDDSPVGDVRRIREQLSARFNNDVRKLGEYIRQAGETKADELGCTIVSKSRETTTPR